MINEDFISFETAKLLKEKGFDIPCRAAYIWNSQEYEFCSLFSKPLYFNREGEFDDYEDDSVPRISAPTLQMAMKWLREERNIFIVIEPKTYDHTNEKISSYTTSIWQYDNYYENVTSKDYSTYEEACEETIRFCLS